MTPPDSGVSVAPSLLTRVTLVAPRRRIDLVLPSAEPIGMLLPEIVSMVGYRTGDTLRGYQISTVDGRVLEPNTSLRGADIADGALLRVDPLTEAPPAAIVHDVSDEVADDLGRRAGRWDDVARRWTITVVVAAAALLAALLSVAAMGAVVVMVTGAVVLAGGSAAALLRNRAVGIAMVLGGATIALTAIPWWTSHWDGRAALWTVVVGVTMAAFGVATRSPRAGLLGAATLLALLGLWAGLVVLKVPVVRAAAVMAVVSVGVLGVLPRVSMMAAGLTRLDDRQTGDDAVSRAAVDSVADSAHRGLALACLAAAVSGAAAGVVLARAGTGWTIALSCLLMVAMLLRLRAFPLAAEVIGLVAAAFATVVGLVTWWVHAVPGLWWGGAAVAVVIAAGGVAVVGVEPGQHLRARARQIADRLEGLVVVALVPVAVGVFGLYSQLLHTF